MVRRLHPVRGSGPVEGTIDAVALLAIHKAAKPIMRIARIEGHQVDLPYSEGVYRLSGGRTYASFDATIVRIETDCGVEGWGECTPFGSNYIAAHALGVRAGIAEIAGSLIGVDPRRLDRVNDLMDAVLVGHPHAKSAIDIACWDIFGRSTGLPVCDLLGGSTGERMPAISSIHVGDPEEMRARVRKYRDRGFRAHSVKIGDDPKLDAERIAASLADKRDGEYFIADANGGMTVEDALRLLRLLPPGLDFALESPCATWRETISLRRRTNIPIIVDELAGSDDSMAMLIADDAADGVGLKIGKHGGLTRSRRHRDLCAIAGLTMAVQDSMASDIAYAAIVHLGQTIPRRLLRAVLGPRALTELRTADGDLDLVDGFVTAPTQPGLGITPRRDILGDPVAVYC